MKRRFGLIVTLAMLGVGLLSGGAVAAIALGPHTTSNTVPFELVKTLLQLSLVSVGVAGLSLLTNVYQRRQDKAQKERDEDRNREELRHELIRSTLSRATENYTSVKRARRLLRVAGLSSGSTESVPLDSTKRTAYYEQMSRVDDAQLEFENLKREVEATKRKYKRAQEIMNSLSILEQYLGDLVTEWEAKSHQFEAPSTNLCKLDQLNDLVAKKKNSRFRRIFAAEFRRLRELLLEELDGT